MAGSSRIGVPGYLPWPCTDTVNTKSGVSVESKAASISPVSTLSLHQFFGVILVLGMYSSDVKVSKPIFLYTTLRP